MTALIIAKAIPWLLDLIGDIRARTKITSIRGHNEVDSGKACPGFWVPDWLRAEGVSL